MADVRIINLNAITQIDKINDQLPIEDVDADETKKLSIKDIAGVIAGNGLGQTVDGSLEVKTDNATIEINSDTLRIKDSGIITAKLDTGSVTTIKIADDAVTKAKLASDVAGWDLVSNADGSLSLKDNTVGDNRLGDKATEDTNLGIALQSYYAARNILINNGNSSFGSPFTKANLTISSPDNNSGIIPATYLPKTFQVQATVNSGSTYFYTPEQSGSGVTSVINGFWVNRTKLQAFINALSSASTIGFDYWFYTGSYNNIQLTKQELQDILDKKLFVKSKVQSTGWQNTITLRVLAHQDDWIYLVFVVNGFSGTPVNWKIYLLWNTAPEVLYTNPWEFLNFTLLKNEKFIIPWAVYKDGTSAIPNYNLLTKNDFDSLKALVDPVVAVPETFSNQGITFKQLSYLEKSGNYLNYLNGQNSQYNYTAAYGTITSALETTGEIVPSSLGVYKRTFTPRAGGNDYWYRTINVPANTKRIKFGAWFEKSSLLALANALPDDTAYIRFWIFLNSTVHGEKLVKTDMLGFLNTPKSYRKASSYSGGGITSTTTVYCGGESTNWVFIIFDTVINSGTISSSSFYWEVAGGAIMNANPHTLYNMIILIDDAAEQLNGYMLYKEIGGGVQENNVLTKAYVDSKLTAPSIKNKIRVLKVSENIYIRSYFNESKDVVVQYTVNGTGTNQNIGIGNTYLIDKAAADTTAVYTGGVIIHSGGDDICPWSTQNTGYIGGNHGFNTAKVTVASHDKATADVGSLWTDGVREWYLADIISGTSLHFSCKTSGSPWTATSSITGSTLTHVSGATNTSTITITAQELLQARPITLNRAKKYLLDGKHDLTDGAVGYADFFDIVDLYDMVDPSTITISYPVNWSNGSAWVRNKITYRFGNYGSTVVNYTAEILRPLNLNYMGFMQSAKVNKGSYDKIFAYMPKVLTNNGYDLKAIIDFTSNPSVSLYYTDTYLESASNPPDRLVEFLGDNDGTKRVGYVHGYNIVYGLGKSTNRDTKNTTQWNIHTSSKSYPHCIDNLGNIPANTVFQVIAYRQYFDPQLYPNTTCVYHHKVGNNDMVYIDIHQNVTNLKIQLPSFMTGKTITVVEKDNNLTLVTDEVVTSDGVIVTVTNNYGYIVLKLS